MKRKALAAFAALGVAAMWTSPGAHSASFDCNARGLVRAQVVICTDPQLSRTDSLIARRADALARRMNYGQYLGLRHWQATAAQERNLCDIDRACITAHNRAQARLLDRLQQCLESRFSRRTCLRESLAPDREASGAAGRRGAAGGP
jgi:uncharacterized protein